MQKKEINVERREQYTVEKELIVEIKEQCTKREHKN